MMFHKRNLSALQRRSLQLFSGCIMLLVVLTVVRWEVEFPALPGVLRYALAVSPVLPIAGMMAVVGRYVARESDEFIKTLVTQSVLWAVGFTLVAGVVMGSLAQYLPRLGHLMPIVSVDMFCVVFVLVLRTQLWRNM